MLHNTSTVPSQVIGGKATPRVGRGSTEEGGLSKGQIATMVGRGLSSHKNHPR